VFEQRWVPDGSMVASVAALVTGNAIGANKAVGAWLNFNNMSDGAAKPMMLEGFAFKVHLVSQSGKEWDSDWIKVTPETTLKAFTTFMAKGMSQDGWVVEVDDGQLQVLGYKKTPDAALDPISGAGVYYESRATAGIHSLVGGAGLPVFGPNPTTVDTLVGGNVNQLTYNPATGTWSSPVSK
jgi:hypothetical protein